jgi:hypothetical protein
VHGRRLGIDRLDFLVGPVGMRLFSEDFGTTVPSTVAIGGLTRVNPATSTMGPVSNFLPAPVPGVIKTISLVSTSTASIQFGSTANGASIVSASDGTTKAVLNFLGPGGSVTLHAASTSKWEVISMIGGSSAAPNISFTTST